MQAQQLGIRIWLIRDPYKLQVNARATVKLEEGNYDMYNLPCSQVTISEIPRATNPETFPGDFLLPVW